MADFIVVKFIILYALLDVATGTEYCAKEFRRRGYITKYADGLKRTDLEVKYRKTPVKCGETVSLLDGSGRPPILKLDLPVDKCRNVTVIAFGPDQILNPPHLYWLVHNIPSVALQKGWTNGGSIIDKLECNNEGDVKASYMSSKIPQEDLGIGHNTVIFFVYCQCRYISDIQPFPRTDRIGQKFDVKSYAAKHGLKCPVAGLFHQYSVTDITLGQTVKVRPVNLGFSPAGLVPIGGLPVVATV